MFSVFGSRGDEFQLMATWWSEEFKWGTLLHRRCRNKFVLDKGDLLLNQQHCHTRDVIPSHNPPRTTWCS